MNEAARTLIAAACALALAASFSACGEDDEPAPTTTAATTPASPGPLGSRLAERIAELLQRRGLDPAVAECAVERLGAELGESELERTLERIERHRPTPRALLDAASDAGAACAAP
jgi:ABC-type amino acid transport substrate-binding protein